MRAKGSQASRVRQKKYEVLGRLELPEDALPGSLSLTHRRCGRANCHCAEGEGHPMWSLTFMVDGKKHVERIPTEWVEQVRQRVAQGRAFKKAWSEVLSANAKLLVLERRQQDRGRGKS